MNGIQVGRVRRLLAVILLAAAGTACGEGTAREAPGLQTSGVERQDLRITAEATGQMEPIRKVEVKSKASGEILRMHVDIGDRVETGALLAEVDPRDVQNHFNQVTADHEVAQARFEIAESQKLRSENLLAAGVITEQEHEGRNLEFANARAALVKAETSLALARLQLQDVTIRAPMAGTVLDRTVEAGFVIQSASGNVSGGTTLLTMASLDEMQVRTLVDETDVGRIAAGMAASVKVEAFPDQRFEGFVEKVEPQAVVQQNVVMFPVIVKLDNRAGLLKPGMSAEVAVLIAERNAVLTLPNNAMVTFQEMAPAAMVLGMNPESIQMDRSVFQALNRQLREATDAAEGGAGAGSAAAGIGPGAGQGGEGRPDIAELRARVARGEISPQEVRALGGTMRGAQDGAPGGGFRGGAGARAGGAGAVTTNAPRQAIVFVMKDDGSLEARPILLGVNDWDRTEVLAGLEEGERVAIIGAAQLQASQQQWIEQLRARQGNSPFGGGVPGGGMRR
ncbi:MAG: efflux RND transporter periplasmic adaptor subunit [Gemmatimonadota bacterium]